MVREETPLTLFMAMKNDKEVEGMKEAHIRDAIAIIEFLAWFEKEIQSGRIMNEIDVDRELTARRAAQKGYKGLSFPTIAGMSCLFFKFVSVRSNCFVSYSKYLIPALRSHSLCP